MQTPPIVKCVLCDWHLWLEIWPVPTRWTEVMTWFSLSAISCCFLLLLSLLAVTLIFTYFLSGVFLCSNNTRRTETLTPLCCWTSWVAWNNANVCHCPARKVWEEAPEYKKFKNAYVWVGSLESESCQVDLQEEKVFLVDGRQEWRRWRWANGRVVYQPQILVVLTVCWDFPGFVFSLFLNWSCAWL